MWQNKKNHAKPFSYYLYDATVKMYIYVILSKYICLIFYSAS